MTGAPGILVVTHFPSPYQVELFNEVERARPGALHVCYLFRRLASRSWSGVAVTHAHSYLDEGHDPVAAVEKLMQRAELVVFNYYNDARAAELIRRRDAQGGRWCFWGERPGYRFPWLARLLRRSRLAPLRAGHQPIWGIGRWAVDAYRPEFGSDREYVNLPYYSNLTRFQAGEPSYSPNLTFLFSGSLIMRKGVDLLARAFLETAARQPSVRLRIMGEGLLESRLRATLGHDSRVDWVGFKDWTELPSVYATAHVLCVPSRHDGWGLVVPEGLASGLPVIATDRTGAALDLVRPNHNGWLVEAGDGDGLAHAMLQAARLDAGEWQAMSRRARASVAHHSLSEGARRFLCGTDRAIGAVA